MTMTTKRVNEESLAHDSKKAKLLSNPTKETEVASFHETYKALREYCVSLLPNYEMPKVSIEYVTKLIDHNVPGGKLNRGLTTVAVTRSMMGSAFSEESLFQAQVLGWCVEWLQACFLVADDLMDSSITRRGQPCWYKLPGVGLNAVNDYTLLQSLMYKVIKKYFGSHPRYVEIFELFNEVRLQTEAGQLYDLTTSPNVGKVDINNFTMENYKRIVKYKTAFYTFYLPMSLGMIVAGVTDEASFEIAKSFCCEIGEYFQIQDDFLDCYGDPAVIGKIGTDIEDNKCCWMVVQALSRANDAQKQVIIDNYGRKEKEHVAKIKALYKDLDLASVFAKYEEDSYARLQSTIERVNSDVMPKAVFTETLAKIYKRSK